ncbi:FadR/GntR family transcriptional regulator [Aquibacillus salsiterrae]|uniref:FCD domain-containing protein n=1 Tax=Aquibacillus salsiterrae TaxID=2950439 RepID=A0A9X3WJM3_9BACI|nr:FCD domain-containing protein [Aquibacillus salsiterrae]MDC3418549.1 FCD domain-containing protein [Aquibacillus salsiterrae]
MTEFPDKRDLKNQIIEIVVDCLSIGRKLPSEKELVERLGVSRSGLRELLVGFEESGIIVATKGKGREVKLPDISNSISGGWNILLRARPESLLELLNVRYVLERGFLPVAIESLTLEDLEIMRDLVSRMIAKAKRNDVFTEEDHKFHRILYSRIDNLILDQLLSAFWNLLEETSELQRSDDLIQGAELHQDLFQAILIQDYEEAERMLEMQFTDVRSRLKVYVENQLRASLREET